MADYKTCVLHDMGLCPMARRWANKPNVTLDCSKCKDYRSINERQEEMNMKDTEQKHDAVSNPSHYYKGGVECLDAIKAALGDKYEGFLAGNVLKYVYRYPDKNGVEDCKKARYCLDKLIEELSDEE